MSEPKKKETTLADLEAEALPLTQQDHHLSSEIDKLMKQRNEVRRNLRGVINKITTKKMHETASKK